jgi:hypothetical protein
MREGGRDGAHQQCLESVRRNDVAVEARPPLTFGVVVDHALRPNVKVALGQTHMDDLTINLSRWRATSSSPFAPSHALSSRLIAKSNQRCLWPESACSARRSK